MTTKAKTADTAPKVPATAAEARALAERLAAEEAATRKAQQAARTAARAAAARDLLATYVDGDLKNAVDTATEAENTAANTAPFNVAAWMQARADHRIAYRVHATVEHFLVSGPIWEGDGRPHDTGQGMPAARYIRPHVQARSGQDDRLRLLGGNVPNGIDNAIGEAVFAAERAALAHVRNLLHQAEETAVNTSSSDK